MQENKLISFEEEIEKKKKDNKKEFKERLASLVVVSVLAIYAGFSAKDPLEYLIPFLLGLLAGMYLAKCVELNELINKK